MQTCSFAQAIEEPACPRSPVMRPLPTRHSLNLEDSLLLPEVESRDARPRRMNAGG